jgi:hypothetical protein
LIHALICSMFVLLLWYILCFIVIDLQLNKKGLLAQLVRASC